MASQQTKDASAAQDDGLLHDKFIDEAQQAEEESGAVRNLFDLRVIIGGLFVVYGIYLTIRGIIDSNAAVQQAAGVRINLWTGLAALVMGGGFLLWAMLRPLTLDEIVEGQGESVDQESAHDELRLERERSAGETSSERARPSH
jgi:hypothetical protein